MLAFRLELLHALAALEHSVAEFVQRWQEEGEARVYRIALYAQGRVPDIVNVEPVDGADAVELTAAAVGEFELQAGQAPGSVFRLPGVARCCPSLMSDIARINDSKDRFREAVAIAAPSSRARNTLVRRLFPGKNMLQVYRHIHCASSDISRIAFSWSPVTSASTTLARDDAIDLIVRRRDGAADVDPNLFDAFTIALDTLAELSPSTLVIQRRPVAPHPRMTLFTGSGRDALKRTHHANIPVFVSRDQSVDCGALKSYDPSSKRRMRRDTKNLQPLLFPLHLYIEH